MTKNKCKSDGLHWFVMAVILSFSLIRMCPAVIDSITVDRSLVYDGEIIDLTPVKKDVLEDGMIHISKLNSKTRKPVASGYSMEQIGSPDDYKTMLFPKMEKDGSLYQLRFEDNRLTGYLVVDDSYLEKALHGEYNTDIRTMQELMMEYTAQAAERGKV